MPVDEPIILGESRRGEEFTLVGCTSQAWPIPVGDVTVQVWKPKAALRGAHLTRPEELMFDRVECEFDYLLDWAGRQTVNYHPAHGPDDRRSIQVDAKTREIGRASAKGARISLRVNPAWKSNNTDVEIRLYASFSFRLHNPIDWMTAYRAWVVRFRDLISFATLRANRIEWIRLYNSRSRRHVSVELILQLLDLDRPPRHERNLVRDEMLFNANAMPSGFESTVRRWLDLRERYESVFLPLLASGYAPFTYDNHRFLDFAQAAEIFHRLAIGGKPRPKDEHQLRVNSAVIDIKDLELKSWAKAILNQSNSYRLGERIDDLICKLGELGLEITNQDPVGFRRSIVATRNYLTHRSYKGPATLEGADRYWYGQALVWLLRAWIMVRLGLSVDATTSIIRRNQEYLIFRQNASLYACKPNG